MARRNMIHSMARRWIKYHADGDSITTIRAILIEELRGKTMSGASIKDYMLCAEAVAGTLDATLKLGKTSTQPTHDANHKPQTAHSDMW